MWCVLIFHLNFVGSENNWEIAAISDWLISNSHKMDYESSSQTSKENQSAPTPSSEKTTPSSTSNSSKPTICIIIGMAGSGKISFF